MDKPKTPEESKFSEDDFKYYTDTIVRIMKNAICKQGSTPNDAIDELNSFFAYAISAERNANLEKIREIEDLRKTSWLLYQDHKAKNVELGAELIQIRFDKQNLEQQVKDFVSEINNLGGQLNQANTKISSLKAAFKILEDK